METLIMANRVVSLEKGREALRMTAQALNKIRDQELYLDEGYQSFNQYCEQKLGMSYHVVQNICEADDTIKTLEGPGKIPKEELPKLLTDQRLDFACSPSPDTHPFRSLEQQDLYLLVFKDEPLFKLGLSKDLSGRCLSLGPERFDLKASFLIQAFDQASISMLERNLKTFFWPYQRASPDPLPNGNTETFHRSALPKMLEATQTLAKAFPLAGFRTQQDLSLLISRPPLAGPESFRRPGAS